MALLTEFLLRRGMVVKVRVAGRVEVVKLGYGFTVRVGAMCVIGATRGFLCARDRRDAQRYRGSCFASVAHVGLAQQLAQVLATLCRASPSGVSRFVDLHPQIHQPMDDQHCWHVCWLLHRCWLLRGPEAACKR